MLSELEHRGPDDGRIAAWENAVLGARRLAIFDTSSSGAQPMLSPDRSVAVVFNGAIYNFGSLRDDLKTMGFRFRTTSDTETLLHGYTHWGIEGLASRLEGMFAFCIWDNASQRLFLVRDPLGIKPLAYTSTNQYFAFASTVKALRRARIINELSPHAMLSFLERGFVDDHDCIYRDARKAPPGCIVEWDRSRLLIRTYHQSTQAATDSSMTFADVVEETERRLLVAVERRLNADVPVGALLSGGVDSALVCWAAKHAGANIPVYTLQVAGPGDESGLAAQSAGILGLNHRIVSLQCLAADLHELTDAFAEPFASVSALGMLRLSRALRDHVTVLLTGDGGDEAFLGYPSHLYYWIAQRTAQRLPDLVQPIWKELRKMVPHYSLLRRASHFLDYSTGGLAAALESHTRLPCYLQRNLLGENISQVCLDDASRRWSIESARRLLIEFQEYHLSTRLGGEFLPKIDGSTSYFGMEARSPFLDGRLWDFAQTIPIETRLYKGRTKAVLRELAFRNIGPGISTRRKRGFDVPVNNLLTTSLRRVFIEAFEDSNHGGWLNNGAILAEFDGACKRPYSGDHLWFLLILQLWLRRDAALNTNSYEHDQKILPEVPTLSPDVANEVVREGSRDALR